MRIDGKVACTDYNGSQLAASAMRVYVQMRIQTADQFTVTYKVAAPTGLLTHSVLHGNGDSAIDLLSYDSEKGSSSVTVDGVSYPGVQRSSENGVDYYFDGWYLDGRYSQRAVPYTARRLRRRSTRATCPRPPGQPRLLLEEARSPMARTRRR